MTKAVLDKADEAQQEGEMSATWRGQAETVAPGKARPTHPDLARLGSHHEGRQAVIVEHGLQVAVREEAGTLEKQQVIHLGDKLGVLTGVVGDGHQRVQHRVSSGVLSPHVRLLVRVLSQVVDDVRLVGAGCQGQGQLTWGRGKGGSVRGLRWGFAWLAGDEDRCQHLLHVTVDRAWGFSWWLLERQGVALWRHGSCALEAVWGLKSRWRWL